MNATATPQKTQGQTRAMSPLDQQKRSIATLLRSESVQEQLALALPKYLTPDRMMRVALTTINRNPKLLGCTPESLLSCLMQCAQAGLEPDGRNAHLIPYGDQCTVIFDWKGLVSLARRNGVKAIHGDVVCDNDFFEPSFEGGVKLVHKVDYRKPRGAVYAAYCYAIIDGEPDYEVMNLQEIEAIRKRSMAGNSGPWVKDWNEMAKKTVLRRFSKRWPLDPEVAAAMNGDDDVDPNISEPKRGVVTAPPTFLTPPSEPENTSGAFATPAAAPNSDPEEGDPVLAGPAPEAEPEHKPKAEPELPDLGEMTPLEQLKTEMETAGITETQVLAWGTDPKRRYWPARVKSLAEINAVNPQKIELILNTFAKVVQDISQNT